MVTIEQGGKKIMIDKEYTVVPTLSGVTSVLIGAKVKIGDDEHWQNILDEDDWKIIEHQFHELLKNTPASNK